MFHGNSSIIGEILIGEVPEPRNDCRITLIKLYPTPWMNTICNDLSPGLDIQESDDQIPSVSAPPPHLSQPTTKKGPALSPSSLFHPTIKMKPAPPTLIN
ncbi:unnamed protein product [Rotaria magnacalcarata]|uniref:Uncharacterized protein n=3 Tax=Rotaria magnacalcarata TaxID=392030 RepID=A0A815ILR4_9BILA|nr:unnamed protein product [Rotaria magnacalcarata]CAF1619283.1 unnamed protein product [Rotaria magnacalcarata]CAF3891361.1 unnamed protein product [Rotaria magnacalcarata]CAF3914562.1 unnamed protein product [Rotaria magnacalcarata]